MLEIILIIVLWNKMGEMMRNRGVEKPIWFQLLVPVCSLGAEFVGGFAYAFFRSVQGKETTGLDGMGYLIAIGGAVLATCALFLIASLLPKRP